MDSPYILTKTKTYIVDLLNSLYFSNIVYWDGIDQYNELPILSFAEDENQEQRGALLVHTKKPQALLCLVTVQSGDTQKVCYRLVGVDKTMTIEDPPKICHPMKTKFDFSISDLNLFVQEVSSLSFSDNLTVDKHPTQARTFCLLDFLINSALVVKDEPELFKDLLLDVLSLPPLVDDPHYIPVFGMPEAING